MDHPIAIELDHVGIAARSFHEALSSLCGPLDGQRKEMPSGVSLIRFGPQRQLELVWPMHPGTPIDRFLERRGPGLHHLAFRVARPLLELSPELERLGIQPTGEIEPSSDGRPSVFLNPSALGGVLIELVEGPPR